MTLGDKIRQLRLKAGREMSQRELAERIGIQVTYLSKIENGKIPPYLSEKKLKKIVAVLDLNEKEERELFDIAKKISPSIKKQATRKPIYQFLRTVAPNYSDEEIEKLIKEGVKKSDKSK